MARGGYQPPSNPAPVSGPGRMSKRTDGIKSQGAKAMPDAAYGEQKEMMGIQQAAPMSASPMRNMAPEVVPLSEPTRFPDQPVTAGMDAGPGPGRASIGLGSDMPTQTSIDAQQLKTYLPSLEQAANMPGVPTSFVRFVRYLRSMP